MAHARPVSYVGNQTIILSANNRACCFDSPTPLPPFPEWKSANHFTSFPSLSSPTLFSFSSSRVCLWPSRLSACTFQFPSDFPSLTRSNSASESHSICMLNSCHAFSTLRRVDSRPHKVCCTSPTRRLHRLFQMVRPHHSCLFLCRHSSGAKYWRNRLFRPSFGEHT